MLVERSFLNIHNRLLVQEQLQTKLAHISESIQLEQLDQQSA
jgi:hypothetical protein